MKAAKQLKLGLSLRGGGYHAAAWRHPDVPLDAERSVAHYVRVAQTAERGKFDMIFLADALGVRKSGNDFNQLSLSGTPFRFEPVTILSALAMVTQRIGLVATASTSYHEPYHVARLFGSLDLICGGRAGWNVVTSIAAAEAQNFSRDAHFGVEDRYARAREFVEVVFGLWNSWDEKPFTNDRSAERFFDPGKLHRLDHKGDYYAVRGPLNLPPLPQRRPVISQAGASDAGQDLAAATADIVFSAQQTIEGAQAFYRSVKDRTVSHGRSPEAVKLMPGLLPIVGRTQAEAEDKHGALQALIDPKLGLSLIEAMVGDLSGYPVDGPVPVKELLADQTTAPSIAKALQQMSQDKGFTIRQLWESVALGRGHGIVVGTPETIADHMQYWMEAEAADGFNIVPSHLPVAIDDFVDLVVPELQRRGLFRTDYEGETFRDHLGAPL
ncbi:nitrilotriacetate monooxygenase [Sphingobium sp. 22B]|uniref:LLM class flavin-dependent oxidoreductase n=1 Tax=unclassified Sphingobium TaxID=2611147 RepID=UPI00078585B4|nr:MULTISPECIES: LLM class flavin-dependent oxidoreductase [unclassified Sphingobium]KXU31497.1 nitrilotriacetate monooxygenase [Sphingobium sp. AM]KYC31151.1 nitrilotriacetate monooxygenase [Sphingobium sp. 22B]OAP31153.1 nitrilotriacetate monooxygenase [Sphingobium sp. 20006FA]